MLLLNNYIEKLYNSKTIIEVNSTAALTVSDSSPPTANSTIAMLGAVELPLPPGGRSQVSPDLSQKGPSLANIAKGCQKLTKMVSALQ